MRTIHTSLPEWLNAFVTVATVTTVITVVRHTAALVRRVTIGTTRAVTFGVVATVLSACAATTPLDALQVNVVGVDQLPGEGLELRMAVKLRIQNPNNTPLTFDGVALNLELRGHDFANGVSNHAGTIPRFGETVLVVPVSVSATAVVRQIYSLAMGDRGSVNYIARGKLSGTGVLATRFETKGQMQLPTGLGGESGGAATSAKPATASQSGVPTSPTR
jgi:LEA14-like dessication related protein